MTKKIGSLLNDYQIGDFLSDTPPGKPVVSYGAIHCCQKTNPGG